MFPDFIEELLEPVGDPAIERSPFRFGLRQKQVVRDVYEEIFAVVHTVVPERVLHHLSQVTDEFAAVSQVRYSGQLDAVPKRQRSQRIRQVIGRRELSGFHQNGDDSNPLVQPGLDFLADVIGWIVDPPPARVRAVRVHGTDPPSADQHEYRTTSLKLVLQVIRKTDAGGNVEAVEEHGVRPEVVFEQVGETLGGRPGIGSPVRNEQPAPNERLRHWGCRGGITHGDDSRACSLKATLSIVQLARGQRQPTSGIRERSGSWTQNPCGGVA